MPGQLFTYYIENPLVTISINSRSWGGNGYLSRLRIWEIGKDCTKSVCVGKEWVVGSCCILWPLCVFGYISVVVMEGACVRNCRGLGLCTVGIVG
jgi:hypothetical protein